jgi:hypothetical protein
MCGSIPPFFHKPSYNAQGQVQIGKYKGSYLFFCVLEFLISRSYSTSIGRFTLHLITTAAVINRENSQRYYAMCYVPCKKPYLSKMFKITMHEKDDEVTDDEVTDPPR